MNFDPSKWFIGALEFFGVLVPGTLALYILRATGILAGIIIGFNPDWPKTNLDYAAFLAISFGLGYLMYPPGHLLNFVYNWTYLPLRLRKGDPLLDEVMGLAGAKGSNYGWVKSEVTAADPKQLARIDLLEGVSKMFRSLAILALVAAAVVPAARWAGIETPIEAGGYAWSIVWLIVAFLLFLVFCERRFASRQELYQTYVRLKKG